MKRSSVWLLLAAARVCAHTVSMSTGDLRVDESRATYELRMPLYEVTQHVADPQRVLGDAVQFAGWTRLRHACAAEGDAYVCRSEWTPRAGDISVVCKLARATVPNHVHLLRAYRGGRVDQAAFDVSFEQATLRFRDLTSFEKTLQVLLPRLAQPGPLLLGIVWIAVLAAAGRSACAGFAAAAVAAYAAASRLPWQFAPRFLEAAAALACAYLAVEVTLLPPGRARWLAAAAVGLFAGLYGESLVRGASTPVWLAGAAVVAIALAAAALWHGARLAPRVVSGAAGALAVAWFAWRLLAVHP